MTGRQNPQESKLRDDKEGTKERERGKGGKEKVGSTATKKERKKTKHIVALRKKKRKMNDHRRDRVI